MYEGVYVRSAMSFARTERKLGLKLEGRPPRVESNSMKGQRSSRGQVTLETPFAYQIWFEEPLTRA